MFDLTKLKKQYISFYNKQIITKMLDRNGMSVLDFWQRSLLPKNTLKLPLRMVAPVDRIDNWLCFNTALKYLATNIEFVAAKL